LADAHYQLGPVSFDRKEGVTLFLVCFSDISTTFIRHGGIVNLLDRRPGNR